MSVTYGFYNSLDHDRLYNAEEVASIFDGLINNGVYQSIGTAMMVTPSSGMTVNIGIGRAWFNHTWTLNNAVLPITLEGSNASFSRIDAIVLHIDTRKTGRTNSFQIIEGTPATNPVKPSIASGHSEVFNYALAYVTVRAGATSITAANIENVVGTSATPFVTGIVQVMSIDGIIAQWNGQWQEWLASKPAEFSRYIDQQKEAFDRWIAADKAEITAEHEAYTQYVASFEDGMEEWKDDQQSAFSSWRSGEESTFETWEQTQKSGFESWRSGEEFTFETWEQTQKDNFDAWFATISYVLDGDAAGHLQVEIDDINRNWDSLEAELRADVEEEIEASSRQLFDYYYGLESKLTRINQNGSIVETNPKAVATTTFEDTSSGKLITTTIVPNTGTKNYIKETLIADVTGGKTITESYREVNKEA